MSHGTPACSKYNLVELVRKMPKTIVHIGKYYPPHMGGMETHLRDLVSGMSSSEDVRVIVAGDSIRGRVYQMDGAVITCVPTLGVVASMPVTPTMPWELMKVKPALVHVQVPNPGAAFAIVLARYRGPLVITHQSDTLGRKFLKKISDPFVNAMMRRADRIIVTSQRYLASSEELAPFRAKCSLIPMGIRLEKEREGVAADSAKIIQKYGPRLVLAVGRLVGYKGFVYLLEAMCNVDATLLLVGTGPLYAELNLAAQSFGVSHKVKFLGKVDDLLQYYRASSIFVLPSISRAEAFGLVQLEAMAAELPVVNTDVNSGVPEISIDGVTGITVPPKDAHALARALNRLLADAALRKTMGEAGGVRAHREFSPELMIERTMKLYEDVLQERRGLHSLENS
jgi:glycosyltransferase involved in cell wall biosynthesis